MTARYNPKAKRAINGLNDEKQFMQIMKTNGFAAKWASEKANKIDHIDCYVWINDVDGISKEKRIDIKGFKSSAPQGTTWIETDNEYGISWLYAPRVTHIAFKHNEGFVIIKRLKLVEIVNTFYGKAKTPTSNITIVNENPKIFCYRRKSCKREKVILIDTNIILECGTYYKAK